MTDDAIHQHTADDEPTARETVAETAEERVDEGADDRGDDAARDDTVQYGVGPFSIREVALAGVWAIAFIVSFFSLSTIGFDSVWTSGLLWILTIGLPTVAVFLLVLRRLSPDGIRRVGSLGIDQFASVAFSVSAVLWLQLVWETVSYAIQTDVWVRSWVMWVELVLMLAGVVLTVFAPILPVLGEDFRHRREIPAHRNARPIRAVSPRPKPEPRPAPVEEARDETDETPAPVTAGAAYVAADPADDHHDTGGYARAGYADEAYRTGSYDTGGYGDGYGRGEDAAAAPSDDVERTFYTGREAGDREVDRSDEAPAVSFFDEPAAADETAAYDQVPTTQQPFWALSPVERDVFDAQGAPLFRVGPTAWALVVEDRGSVYVIRHEDGRIGYLHDVSGITRG